MSSTESSSTKGHKRKRSLDEDPVNVDQLHQLKKHMALLREELDGIEETEGELDTVMTHIGNLERILADVKKPFSSLTKKDLERLGVKGQMLVFRSQGIASLLSKANVDGLPEEITTLRARLVEIYDHVNMDFEAGSRMLLDAVLLSMAKITAMRNTDTSVAILPEMRLASGDGVVIAHPKTNFQAWLTGNVDYGVIQYLDQDDNKARFLGVDASRDGILHLAAGRLFLVEAKRMSDKAVNLSQHMPEAVGQAMALSELTGLAICALSLVTRVNDHLFLFSVKTLRFCLSNGHSWIFAILVKDEAGQRTYYESSPRYLDKTQVQAETASSLASIQEIMELVLQWVRFMGLLFFGP
ncbi:hypothetical protein B0H14DRAFT_2376063 [Mycena olivaceomarginata]|nr:hypothetical protein B0H14DRAFT_2376063 [Mycena olivaceomarginata]